jgi:hypothetical protein
MITFLYKTNVLSQKIPLYHFNKSYIVVVRKFLLNVYIYILGHTVCKTVHRINDRTGESIQVDKMCAMPDQCSNDHVGCKATGLEGEIVSLNSNII